MDQCIFPADFSHDPSLLLSLFQCYVTILYLPDFSLSSIPSTCFCCMIWIKLFSISSLYGFRKDMECTLPAVQLHLSIFVWLEFLLSVLLTTVCVFVCLLCHSKLYLWHALRLPVQFHYRRDPNTLLSFLFLKKTLFAVINLLLSCPSYWLFLLHVRCCVVS